MGNIAKAAETASTFLKMEPSNTEMANNIRFYTKQFKLTTDQFQLREVSYNITHKKKYNSHDVFFLYIYFRKTSKFISSMLQTKSCYSLLKKVF